MCLSHFSSREGSSLTRVKVVFEREGFGLRCRSRQVGVKRILARFNYYSLLISELL